jgi:hypothetical protein
VTFVLRYFPATPGGDEHIEHVDADTFSSDERGIHFFRRGVCVGSLDAHECVRVEHVE